MTIDSNSYSVRYLMRVEVTGHGLAAVCDVTVLVDVEAMLSRGQSSQIT